MKTIILFLFVTFNVYASDNFDYIENNLSLEHDRFEYKGRSYIDKKYTHHEFWYAALYDTMSVAFRYTDSSTKNEYRVSATLDNIKTKYLELVPRIEYIVKDHGSRDISRFRTALKFDYPIGKLDPWIKYEIYTDLSHQEIQQTRANIGITYIHSNTVKLGPYLEERWDDQWNKKFIMIAFQTEIEF